MNCNVPDDECYEEIKQSKEREGEHGPGKLLSEKEVSVLMDGRERTSWDLGEVSPRQG